MKPSPVPAHSQVGEGFYSAPEGIRTPNLLIRSQMLYPLSYGRSIHLSCQTSRSPDSPTWRRREDLNLRSPFRRTTH